MILGVADKKVGREPLPILTKLCSIRRENPPHPILLIVPDARLGEPGETMKIIQIKNFAPAQLASVAAHFS